MQARVKEKEKDMQKMFSDKENALQEKQVSVAKKLGEAEHKAATLQAGKDHGHIPLTCMCSYVMDFITWQ